MLYSLIQLIIFLFLKTKKNECNKTGRISYIQKLRRVSKHVGELGTLVLEQNALWQYSLGWASDTTQTKKPVRTDAQIEFFTYLKLPNLMFLTIHKLENITLEKDTCKFRWLIKRNTEGSGIVLKTKIVKKSTLYFQGWQRKQEPGIGGSYCDVTDTISLKERKWEISHLKVIEDKQNVVYTFNRTLFCLKKKWNSDTCHNLDGDWRYYAKWTEPDMRKQYRIVVMIQCT